MCRTRTFGRDHETARYRSPGLEPEPEFGSAWFGHVPRCDRLAEREPSFECGSECSVEVVESPAGFGVLSEPVASLLVLDGEFVDVFLCNPELGFEAMFDG